MATHSSVLAWRIPGTGESGGLPSRRSHRVGHDWSDAAAAELHNQGPNLDLAEVGVRVLSPTPGVPTLWDLMPDDLSWSWCNNNRNKVHNKCYVLNHLQTHPFPTPSLWKNCLPQDWSLVPKSLGTSAYSTLLWIGVHTFALAKSQEWTEHA